MATATETIPSAIQPPAKMAAGSILPGSLIGAVVVIAGVFAAGAVASAIPLAAADGKTVPFAEAYQIVAYLGVLFASIFLAGKAAAVFAANGIRGGIVATVTIALTALFLATGAWINGSTTLFGQIATGAITAVGVFGIFHVLTSKPGLGWCREIESQGWASLFTFKKNQGQKMRRYTMIGVLIVGCTGALALYESGSLPVGTLGLTLPFVSGSVPLIPIAAIVLPLLVGLGTIWIAWRLTNMPTFGDFLISTEAEMNKVSWVKRKQLIQDTIVVLVTVVVLTSFLLLIDLFWGWLLSRQIVGVLPPRQIDQQQTTTPDGGVKLEW